jgi:signal peptidase I
MTGRAILAALLAALVMKFFILDFMIAEGNSMVPAIKSGAILTVYKASYGIRLPGSSTYVLRWGTPKEGDVVIFYTPSGEVAVKRCGDSLADGFFYLFGDNSSQSYDSRNYGPIPKNHIIGKVLGK